MNSNLHLYPYISSSSIVSVINPWNLNAADPHINYYHREGVFIIPVIQLPVGKQIIYLREKRMSRPIAEQAVNSLQFQVSFDGGLTRYLETPLNFTALEPKNGSTILDFTFRKSSWR